MDNITNNWFFDFCNGIFILFFFIFTIPILFHRWYEIIKIKRNLIEIEYSEKQAEKINSK